ncbi:uncharacterized protein LOC106164603 [Lingula anatina]|uniref:Uncharacterized protein LOC106164603 n=1 Tax=Lingula anatina TaxID=7574 RepID=A0A1S3III4_LINAN|nr:uncharacterized protein LOC106164603 [Lingula anatina]|eukprot:XP_013398022.1 uncharacterized protein LOC106164603 [Lingula anatina]
MPAKIKGRRSAAQESAIKVAERRLLSEMAECGFDGKEFAKGLDHTVTAAKMKGKTHIKIRFMHYSSWARALKKQDIGPDGCHYSFPADVLSFIRAIIPNQVKAEIRQTGYAVSMEEFCQAVL